MNATMGMMGLGIVLTLRDQVSRGLDTLRQKLVGFKNLSQETLKTFDDSVKQIMTGFGMLWAGNKLKNVFTSMFGGATMVAANFQQAMARVKAVAGDITTEMFADLREKAEQLGRETQFTPMDAASALETIIRAGQKPEQALKSVDSVLQLAAADGLSLAESADMISSSMNMFGKKAEEASDIANLFAQASRSSSLNSRTLAEALSYAGVTAKQAGMNMEETVGWISVLSDAGLKSSRAGSAFRRIIPTLIKEKANLGISLTDDKGNPLSKVDLFKSLSEKLREMSRDDAVMFLNKTFKQLGQDAAGILADAAQSGKLEAAIAKMKNFGTAAGDMSKIMIDTLPGAMKYLESATMGLDIAIGDLFTDAYKWVITKLGDFKNWITSLIKDYPLLSKLIIGGTGALLAFASAALMAGGAILVIGGTMHMWKTVKPLVSGVMRSMVTHAGSVKAALTGMASPILWLIALAGALYVAYKTNLGGIRDMFSAISEGWSMFLSADENGLFHISDEKEAELRQRGIWGAAMNMAAVFWRLKRLWDGFVEGIVAGFSYIGDVFSWIGGIFEPFIAGGEKCLQFLGVLNPMADSSADIWKTVGKWIGIAAVSIGSFFAAWKTASKAISALKGIKTAIMAIGHTVMAHPVLAAIALTIFALYELWQHWDDVKWAFGKGIDWLKSKWEQFCNFFSWIFEKSASLIEGALNIIIAPVKWLIDSLNWILGKLGILDEQTVKSISKSLNNAPGVELVGYDNKKKWYEDQGYKFDANGKAIGAPAYMMLDGSSGQYALDAVNDDLEKAKNGMQSAPSLAQASQTQAAATIQGIASTVGNKPAQAAPQRVNVENKIASTPVFIDGEKIAEIVHRVLENTTVRGGGSDNSWDAITGLGY